MPTDRLNVLLTGVTGFLGQAVLERLLADTDAHVTAVIRPKGSQAARDRLDRLLRKPVFKTWRDAVGDAEAQRIFAERTAVLEGDLATLESIDVPVDVVVHSASTVSFDAPIDESFANNVGGPRALYGALTRSGLDPHVIHVSTCYVGGIAKGLRPEASVDHDVDWRAELAAAQRRRARRPRRPPAPRSGCRPSSTRRPREHGKEGPKTVARASEQARVDWITARMVELGRTRARSVGWTDVYTFTKALGERVAEQEWAGQGHRLSIVRPSIIESALRHPFPGWIDGFKVADPLIMAYAKGALPEFPGLPDSVLDVIPVDYVVNVMLALGEAGPSGPRPRRDRLLPGVLRRLEPAAVPPDVRRGAGLLPAASPRGRQGASDRRADVEVPGQQRRRALAAAQGAAVRGRLPDRRRAAVDHPPPQWSSSLHKMERGLGSLRTYVDLYQSYTRTEMLFDDQQTRALGAKLPGRYAGRPDLRRARHRLDALLAGRPPARDDVAGEGARAGVQRAQGVPLAGPALESGTDVLAVFDLEGTLPAFSLVTQYLSVMRFIRPLAQLPGETGRPGGKTNVYLQAERRDRGEFVRAFSRRYAGTRVADVERARGRAVGRERSCARCVPGALARIEEHRAAGHRTVLVTGSLDLFTTPLVSLFDEVVASRMEARDGVLSGYLATPPLVDEARAQWLKAYAAAGGYDLSRSHGYGDSVADVSWLRLLGRPVAVNPDLPLYRVASRQYWPIEDWKRS